MKPIFTIAKNTFKETVRDRILYGILGFSFIYVAFTFILAKISLSDPVVLKSFGLAGIYIFGSIITIFLGSSIINKEIERRTLYFVLAKPVSRLHIVVGKFLGLFAAVLVTVAIMTFVYLQVIFLSGNGFDSAGLLAIFFQVLEEALLVAMLVFLSTISTPLTSTIVAAMVLFAGHTTSAVLATAAKIGGVFYRFIEVIYYIFPNLEKFFDLRNGAAHNISPSLASIGITILYAACYAALMLALANYFLKKKEL